jgi:surfactin synthase thioesterase subunit
LHGRPAAPKKLVCFHCAGGNPAMFYDWQRVLTPDMALLAVQIPGRGELYDEATPATISELVESLTPYFFERLQGKQFYFVGHSMGGIVAYEMAQSLARQHQLTAAGLLVLASMAPAAVSQKTDFAASARDNPGSLFPAYQQAIEPSVKANLVELLLNDLNLLDTYRHHAGQSVPLPIISVLGSQDKVVDAAAMHGWEKLASRYQHHVAVADHSSILSNEAVFEIVQHLIKEHHHD